MYNELKRENDALRAEIVTLNAKISAGRAVLNLCDHDFTAAQAEIAELKEQLRWIPVGERLPTVEGEYPAFWRFGDRWIYVSVRYFPQYQAWSGCNPEFWREIPAPPEEQT